MKKQLFIFDLDGTLVDAYQAIWKALLYARSALGYPPVDFETAKRAVGYGDKNYILKFFRQDDVEQARTIYLEYHLKILNNNISLMPGARDILEKLKQNKRVIAVASNRPSRAGLCILENLGIKDFFSKTIFGDQVKQQKPDSEMISKIIEELGINPRVAVFIGDMTIDVATGRNAGVDTIAIPTGSSTLDELRESNPARLLPLVERECMLP
ncbi:MAG TPA: HAD family hydrolase, partial [bacterium]|nr:HAD family hydrolase [bacterium]